MGHAEISFCGAYKKRTRTRGAHGKRTRITVCMGDTRAKRRSIMRIGSVMLSHEDVLF
jgi:hypothetical protein